MGEEFKGAEGAPSLAGAQGEAQPGGDAAKETPAPGLDGTGEKAADGDAEGVKGEKKAAEEKPQGAPEKYEDFKLPEGFEPVPELAESFSALAKELGMTQEAAQKAVDFYLERQKEEGAAALAKNEEFIDKLKAEAMSDPEVGVKWKGDAEKSVALALEKLGTPELKKVIAENPAMGCHVEIIRFFKRAGDLLREGQSVEARAGADAPSAADVLFGDMMKK